MSPQRHFTVSSWFKLHWGLSVLPGVTAPPRKSRDVQKMSAAHGLHWDERCLRLDFTIFHLSVYRFQIFEDLQINFAYFLHIFLPQVHVMQPFMTSPGMEEFQHGPGRRNIAASAAYSVAPRRPRSGRLPWSWRRSHRRCISPQWFPRSHQVYR